MINVTCQMNALKITWIKRYFNSENAEWCFLLKYLLGITEATDVEGGSIEFKNSLKKFNFQTGFG